MRVQKKDNKIYAVGGRVLNFISLSNSYFNARKNIHKNLEKLNWKKVFIEVILAIKSLINENYSW